MKTLKRTLLRFEQFMRTEYSGTQLEGKSMTGSNGKMVIIRLNCKYTFYAQPKQTK